MKKTTVRLISLFLTLIFIISCLGCTPTKNTEKSTEAVDTEQLGNSEKSFALSDEYHIVSHSMYKGTLEIANALSLLRTALSRPILRNM